MPSIHVEATRCHAARRPLATILALLLAAASGARAPAATYTYTIGDSSIYNWSSGTAGGWDSTPASGISTSLVFQGDIQDGSSNTSNNDLGLFTLNSLTISATGLGSTSSGFTISGDPLRFVVNSGTQPSAIAVVSGSMVPSIVISAGIVLDDHLSADVQPVSGFLTLSGTVSGTGSMMKTGAGTLVLASGAVANTATGDTRIGAGTLRLGTPGALAGSTLDMKTGDTGTLGFALGSHTYSLGALKGNPVRHGICASSTRQSE